MSDKENIVKLRLIAALAEDMALKLERNETWFGDLSEAVARIAETLAEIKERK